MSSHQAFRSQISREIEQFSELSIISRARSGLVDLKDYHNVLSILFHQVQNSSSSFALAGALCPPSQWKIKSYLLHHAEEEKDHWQWILDDLKSTNFRGPSPLEASPHWTAAAYIAYNYFVAARWPIGRLGIAVMLETLGARLGEELAASLCRHLKLSPDQATFFMSHGVTDKAHEVDLHQILAESALSSEDWAQLIYHASVAGNLYRQMFRAVD